MIALIAAAVLTVNLPTLPGCNLILVQTSVAGVQALRCGRPGRASVATPGKLILIEVQLPTDCRLTLTKTTTGQTLTCAPGP